LREMADFWLRRSRLPALGSTRAEKPTGSSNVQRPKGEEKQKVTA